MNAIEKKKRQLEKWNAMQARSRQRYAARLAGQPRTKIKLRSSNEFPVALFNASRWFNRWVVARDKQCVTKNMECSGALEASHVFPVSVSSVYRFDPRLVHAQCKYHNQNHSTDTTLLRRYVDNKFGKGFYLKMKVKSTQIKQWSIGELRGIITTYKHLFEQLKKTL